MAGPSLTNRRGETPVVSFALFGAPILATGVGNQRRFFPYEMRLSREYSAAVAALGRQYHNTVVEEFQRTHDRTGRTAHNVNDLWSPNVGTMVTEGAPAVYSVNFPPTVSFVINPIPAHEITPKNKEALAQDMGSGVWGGREINYYSSFGPVHSVFWYQGGDESFSPDREWYKGSVQQKLEVEAVAALNLLAGFSKVQWFDELEGQVLLAEG